MGRIVPAEEDPPGRHLLQKAVRYPCSSAPASEVGAGERQRDANVYVSEKARNGFVRQRPVEPKMTCAFQDQCILARGAVTGHVEYELGTLRGCRQLPVQQQGTRRFPSPGQGVQ